MSQLWLNHHLVLWEKLGIVAGLKDFKINQLQYKIYFIASVNIMIFLA